MVKPGTSGKTPPVSEPRISGTPFFVPAWAFSSLNELSCFRPQPFERPEEIVHVYQGSDDGAPASSSFPAYRRIAENTNVFRRAAAFYPTNAGHETEIGIRTTPVEYATSSYFPVLGLRPSLGRWFTESEDRPGSGAQAVMSYRTWQNRFGSDPEILGKAVRLNGGSVMIVGVGPKSYNGAISGAAIDFWLSLSALQTVAGPYAVQTLDRPEDHWFQIKARLREGTTVARPRRRCTRCPRVLQRNLRAGMKNERSRCFR